MSAATIGDLLTLLDEVRQRHAPYFARLEQAVATRFPLLDELRVGLTVCRIFEQVDAEEAERLMIGNPGLRRGQ